MKDNKTLLQKWFQTEVSLEELAIAESSVSSESSEVSDNVTTDEPTPDITQRPVRLYLAGAIGIMLVVVAAWALSSVYLSQITVASVAVPGHSTDAELAKILDKSAAAYRLGVLYPDGVNKKYPLDRLGLAVDKIATINATRKQQHEFRHRIAWWQPVPATVVLQVNHTVLNKFLASEANVTVQPSKDAVLTIEGGKITITDAVAGKQYGLQQPQKMILSSARSLKPGNIKLKTLIVNPALTASILEPYKLRLETIINQPVSFSVGYKIVTPSAQDVSDWLEITPNDKSKKVDIAVNSGKVLEFINREAANYVFPAKAQIETMQPDGSKRVVVAGVDGVDVTNKSDAAATAAKSLLDSKGVSLPLSVRYETFKTITTGSYDKWIEVDLTHKRMYAYEKDNLVKTELVTAGAPSTPTVTGQYAIYVKHEQQDMRGNNVDGSRYFQPNVRWINYFYRDYAIHGNYWRPLSYFGNINSSHGCVSLVDTEAEWMYSWAPIGTPVIVHT